MEETILARLCEGIVTTVSSSETHKVLENPDSTSKLCWKRDWILVPPSDLINSILLMDVGKNISAQLQIDQAEADKEIAQAKAERRAMAVALEQNMKAK